jgi:Tfp pilus assembly protein PilN
MKAINLLPTDLRGAPKGGSAAVTAGTDEPGGFGAFVVLGALALCVVALGAYVLTTNTVEDREAELAAATAEALATSQRVAQLKPYADFKAMAETRIQTVRDLTSSRFDWEQGLRDISRAIPAEVTLTSLNGTISSQSGGTGIRSAIAAPAVELKGCTTDQKSVAALLSRLRNVDGVERGTLGKTVQPEAPAAGTAATTPGTGAGGCGAGRPPAFELTMFFERSEVPSTVQDLTVTAGATPADGSAAPADPAAAAAAATTPPADPAGTTTATPATTPPAGG